MTDQPLSLADAIASIEMHWSPKIVTAVNDYDVLVATVLGEYVWHTHDDTDEFFLVLDGELHIGLRTAEREWTAVLRAGDAYTVPRGVEHRPVAPVPTQILLFEPTATSENAERRIESTPAQ